MKKKTKIIVGIIGFICSNFVVLGGLIAGTFLLFGDADENMGGGGGSEQLQNLTAEQQQFVDQIVEGAKKSFKEYNVFPSVTVAQAILESDWGKSLLAIKAKNLYGIKAFGGWNGKTISMNTKEYLDGKWVTITALWRAYNSYNDSTYDHGKFLKENSIYTNAGVFTAKNYREQIEAIKKAGYATGPEYVQVICNLITLYGLDSLDGVTQGDKNETVIKAIEKGKSLIGKTKYIFGSGRSESDIKKGHFDCSSFIHYIYACSGLQLGPMEGATTYSLIGFGKPVLKNSLEAGDLIFFNTVGVNSHVGMYIGNGQFIHCSTSKAVTISEFNGYYENVFYQARRVV